MNSLNRIKQEKMKDREKQGQRRGRGKTKFADYSQRVEAKIVALKQVVADPTASEDRKNQVRNQISAYQARLDQRIASMELELKIN